MRTVLIITLSVFMFNCQLGAQERMHEIKSFDVISGFGIGNKSHFGNIGITSNLYFTKNISLKFSAGLAAFNYGEGVISTGPEASFLYFKKGFISLGTAWTYIGEGSDILGDDDSNDYIWYHSSYMNNLKFYLGYSLIIDHAILRFEAGYSHALSQYNYIFSGPGTPTQKQHENIQRGLRSGWMATIYMNLWWSLKKGNTTKKG